MIDPQSEEKNCKESFIRMNRSMPPGVIIPELPYPNVREAVDWLCETFGFTERLRIEDHRAQLQFGEGSLVVTQGRELQSTRFRYGKSGQCGCSL